MVFDVVCENQLIYAGHIGCVKIAEYIVRGVLVTGVNENCMVFGTYQNAVAFADVYEIHSELPFLQGAAVCAAAVFLVNERPDQCHHQDDHDDR